MQQAPAVSREDALESLLQVFLNRREVYRVEEVLKMIGRSLTQQEADSFTRKCLGPHVETALKAACLGASPQAKEELWREALRREDWYRVKQSAEALGKELGRDELNGLLRINLERSNINASLEIVALLGRKLSAEEIQTLREACVKSGYIYLAKEAARLAGKNLTREEIDALVRANIKKRDLNEPISLAEQGASPEVIELLIEACAEGVNLELAKRTVKLREGGKFKTVEIDRMVTKIISERRLREAKEIAVVEPGPSEQTLINLIGELVKNYSFNEPFELVELFKSRYPGLVNTLMERVIESGWFEAAMSVAKLRGKELTTEEILKLREAILPKSR